ncbi:MAG TPA: TlpA disulfide reductase family protein [Rhodanobacter sp.]|nr:TlpA disulfide reductase family protein [Rhodanobacter sp.]
MNLGPFAFSTAVLALLFGFVAAQGAACFLRKRGQPDASNAIYWAMGGALLLARTAYVIGWRHQYFERPLSVLNIRDGGFDLIAGLIGLCVVTAVIAWRRPALRKALAGATVVGIVAWGMALLTARALHASMQQPLPTTALQDVDGRTVTLAGFAGKPLVLNLWATWCGPCRSEMPMLVAAQRTTPGVQFVFVDQGEDRAQVADFLWREGLAPQHVLIDANLDLAAYYGVRGYPTTLFIGRDGVVRDRQMGELSAATLADHLRRIAPGDARRE